MQRTRAERRALTERYVAKQARYYREYNQYVWETGYEITAAMKGRWRNHSFADCGRSNCQMCRNPRRVKWHTAEQRLTLQERRHMLVLSEYLEDYYALSGA